MLSGAFLTARFCDFRNRSSATELSEKASVFVFGTYFWSKPTLSTNTHLERMGPRCQSCSHASDLWPRLVATMGILSSHAQSQVAGPLLLAHTTTRPSTTTALHNSDSKTVSLDTTWARTRRFSARASPHTPDSHADSARTTRTHHSHAPS